MSLPSQVHPDKSKHRAGAMKEGVQHPSEVFYGMGPPALKTGHADGAGGSGVYNSDKGPQGLPQYQQAAQVKWMQDSLPAPAWSQDAPVQGWDQNFAPYVGGVNLRGQIGFHKGIHEGGGLQMGGEGQLAAPVETYRDAAQSQGRGLDWEQHAAAATMHQSQLPAYHHKGVELQGQTHVPPHSLQGPVLQPFQASYRPGKQQFSSGYYHVFPESKNVSNLVYGEQPKTQQQQQQQQQQQRMYQMQQQQVHHQLQQMEQELQLQQQQQHQMQQQQLQQHQMQQQQMQHMRLQQMQQMQEQQQLQQMQQQQMQQHPMQEGPQSQMQPELQQTPDFGAYQPTEPQLPTTAALQDNSQPQLQMGALACDAAAAAPDPCHEKVPSNSTELSDTTQAAPRRSRRLSREGQSPLGPPAVNLWSQASKELPPPQNGVARPKGSESQAATGGVIQITRRRRRASKEINLETLAQKASEMESLPAKSAKDDGAPGRQASEAPLVIPVSVPVPRSQTDPQGGWAQASLSHGERPAGQSERKPSVIVARRRSLKNSATESFRQDGETESGLDDDGKTKFRRRPRPEPLIIPPPKPSSFIPASIYSSITPYQSNLRSPVRLPDNPHALPPYTPPPILSPVRGGSGLYFSAFLTNMSGNQILPPPVTPKSATRSLLRTVSAEVTPPVLPVVTDATPVSLEPRINIGAQYQADIPDLRDRLSSQLDQHQADLVWLPLDESNPQLGNQENLDCFMKMACSSVLFGGGTNQELALHCLHESRGNFLATLERLMLQNPIFPKGHHLTSYHYSGSDRWSAEEKRYFNKGISAYRKDFFLVQKLVRTKTVAQCVEFYYTYKKQVKIGRNSILTFGPTDSQVEKHTEAVLEVKSSQQPKVKEEDPVEVDNKDSHDSRVVQSLQAHDYAGTVLVFKEPDAVKKESHPALVTHKHRAEAAAKKPKPPPKPPQDPDAVFPCKKCGRVFYKVKSRSAHMKSHAEREKKAAALRLKVEEEEAAAAAQAQAMKAAAAAAATTASAAAAAAAHHHGGNGLMRLAEVSSQEDTSGAEDDNDDDWQ